MWTVEQSLREAIQESGLSISELAKRSGVAKSRISTFLNDDENSITLRNAEAIGKVIGWPPRFPILIEGARSWRICRLVKQTCDARTSMICRHGDKLDNRHILQLRYWVVEPITEPEPSDYALARLDADVPTAIEKIFVPNSARTTASRRPKS
jgi:transcriptional regulator with XRE-family HTH domain